MKTKTGRYSGYIRPFSYILDSGIILIALYYSIGVSLVSWYIPLEFIIIWLLIASTLGFYEVYRYTKVIAILNCSLKQWMIFAGFSLMLIFLNSASFSFRNIFFFSTIVISTVLIFKLAIYFFLQKYRIFFGGNFRRVVLLGSPKSIAPLQLFFSENPDYGYVLEKKFDATIFQKNPIKECCDFVLENKIDEMYCAMDDLTQKQISDLVYFADNNLKTLKFIPNESQILSRNFTFDYYDYIPVLSLRTIVLDDSLNKSVKRIFDLLFSALVIIGILTWLTPILAIIIKLESKGPLFFIQRRNGLNYQEFNCYKFRSMNLNSEAHLEQVSKNDPRITRVGRFLRKTSIDELPQFINVFLGQMSVVGPRPHMVSHTEMYAQRVNKFMVRHFVKPGITGLAQTKGYRGEVEKEADIINRVKYDIFYMENWSILLDLKIIVITIFNTLKGEEKAY
ncbi:exopolysaccharide biosynthesis polyprenyl glycosylphosphotransferase [Flavobacterium sp. TSSA_36]|uniref:exopolysaccharide biosynthesis polyprenyl glycosylphosphotransferase n=1 Tax=Flavobacterium sp. TSSA_36 TaxID=3447669 RepID=UPI003F3317FC